MTCRHGWNDPNCGATKERREKRVKAKAKLRAEIEIEIGASADTSKFIIEKAERIKKHLVLQVKYPNCQKCAFEGLKVMVFTDVSEGEALRWRIIDPHFRSPPQAEDSPTDFTLAPSPAARFPGTVSGWLDAIDFARQKLSRDDT